MTDKAITPQEKGNIMIKELNTILANRPLAKVTALYTANQILYSLYHNMDINIAQREYWKEVKSYLETITING